jgi:hypothetical protein
MALVDISSWGTTAIGIATIILFLPVCYSAYKLFMDLNFYRKNGWNFKEDSGVEVYKGAITNKSKESRLSNKTRIFFGHPFLIFVWLTLTFMMASELWRRLQ